MVKKPIELPPLDEEQLRFLRDEGLDMLAVFRSIRDRAKRDLVVALMKAIASGQAEPDGGS